MAPRKSTPTKKFVYKKRSFEDAKKHANQRSNLKDGFIHDDIQFFKPAEGDTFIRILPPSWDDAEHYGIEVYVHYGVGLENQAYLCLANNPALHDPEVCPVCEEKLKAQSEGDEEYAMEMRPTKRVLVYLVNRDKPNEGPILWTMPATVDSEILFDAMDDRTKEVLPLDSPDEGYDIKLHKEGQGRNTKYKVTIDKRSTELEMTDEIIDFLEKYPLPNVLTFYPYEHIKKILEGGMSVSKKRGFDEDEEAESPRQKKPSSNAPAKRATKKAKAPAYTYGDIMNLRGRKLDKVAEEVNIDPDEYEDDDELRKDILEALGIEIEEIEEEEEVDEETEEEASVEEVEEEDEEEAPAPKVSSRISKLREKYGKR